MPDDAAATAAMPKFVMAQIRTTVTLEIRTIEAKNGMEAITAPDDSGEIEKHVITNEVKPVSDCVTAEKADDQWRGHIIHAHADPRKKAPVEKIAGRTAQGSHGVPRAVAPARPGG